MPIESIVRFAGVTKLFVVEERARPAPIRRRRPGSEGTGWVEVIGEPPRRRPRSSPPARPSSPTAPRSSIRDARGHGETRRPPTPPDAGRGADSRRPGDRRSDRPITGRSASPSTTRPALESHPRPISMTISDICIRRPVFTWVLVAIPVVLGLVSYTELGRRPVPQRRLPGLHGHDRPAGGERRGDGDHGHQADRGHHQHGLGHRRAALDDQGGRLDRHGAVPAVEERRRRDAGGARQGQHDPRRPARRDRAADHRQVRHRRRCR